MDQGFVMMEKFTAGINKHVETLVLISGLKGHLNICSKFLMRIYIAISELFFPEYQA